MLLCGLTASFMATLAGDSDAAVFTFFFQHALPLHVQHLCVRHRFKGGAGGIEYILSFKRLTIF